MEPCPHSDRNALGAPCRVPGRTVGVGFERRVTGRIDHRADAPPLLHDVREFVGKKPSSVALAWRILPGAENDVAPDGIGQRVHGPR